MALIARQLSSAKKRKDKLVALCESFPEVVTEEHREHLSFKIRKKIFAYYTLDHHGDGMIAFWCKSTMSEQQQLIREDPDVFFKPPYLGPRGWVAMRIDLDTVDWQAAREIVLRAYQETAPKKLAASVE